MSIKRAMQRILLLAIAMAIVAPAWGDEIGEAGRLVVADDGETDALSDMLRSEDLSFELIVGALALALFLGAAHGLEPGHGKTIVAAYLVGARGTVGNALFLGGVVTLTHTMSVILLGLVALFASQYVLPEQIFPYLGTASGLLIMGLGTWLLVNHLRGRSPIHSHAHEEHRHEHVHSHAHGEYLHGHSHEEEHLHEYVHSHAHEEHRHEHVHSHAHGKYHHGYSHRHEEEHHHGHGHSHLEEHHGHHDHPHGEHHHEHDHPHEEAHHHEHDHPHEEAHLHEHDHPHEEHHGHDHEIPNKVTLGSLLTLGISGGIVPCPGALVILLLAVALHRIAFGLLLLVAFSVGLAAILIAIGVLIVKARPLVERFSGEGRWIQRLPIASTVVIIVVGLVITLKTLETIG